MPKAPRIFVVEDDESIRMLLEVALRSSGYTVSAFPNAADALAEMENTVPDAAVLDIMLDGMDGITALKLMRANARLAGVPVMMLTAKDSENDKIIGLDAGADDFSEDEDSFEILTSSDDFSDVRQKLEEEGIPMASAEVTMIPQNYVALTDETALKQLNRTLDMLDEDDDVQAVYTNLEE